LSQAPQTVMIENGRTGLVWRSFLIYAMRDVFRFIDSRWEDADDRAEQRKDYAQEKLIGMDNDTRLVRVAKAYMIMENHGRLKA
jgi:type I restriction enzyme M protein